MLACKTKRGFTLAEVLVTLAVIGVVAAMAIPALLGNTNQAELKAGLKKAISTMNQALIMSIAQDSVDAQTFTDATNITSQNLMYFFRNKLNVISNDTASYLYTADGMKFTFKGSAALCGGEGTCDTCNDPSTAKCYVTVDVNGDKSPNVVSSGNSEATYAFKDQYVLIIKGKAVLPSANTTSDVARSAISN